MNTVEELTQINAELREENLSQQQRIRLLEEMLITSRQQRFGTSSEKHSPQQALFNEAEVMVLDLDEASSESTIDVPAHTRQRKKRVSIPETIEREEIVYDLPESEKQCPHDGTPLKCMGEETHEQLDLIPAQIKALRHIRKKYACPCCKEYLVTAKKPKQAIEKSIASSGLLAHIAVSKYADGLPLYRQAAMFKRLGIELDKTSLANWMIKCGDLLQPVFNCLQDRLLEAAVIHMDETPVQVLNEPGKSAQSQSYMWVVASQAHHHPVVLYHYSPSRSQVTPNTLLADYQGALMVDGYSGYNGVSARPDVTRLGCWAHARRKFVEAKKVQPTKKTGKADKALAEIQKLYRIEQQCKRLPPDERQRLRQEKAKPIIDKLRLWLVKSIPQVPPQGAIGKALTYLNNQWPHLVHYLDNGDYPIDNNRAENAIRPFVVGRKNWLFSTSQAGARASANLYSLIETAKANGLNPYDYLKTVFTELPNVTRVDDVEVLLPWNVKDVVR